MPNEPLPSDKNPKRPLTPGDIFVLVTGPAVGLLIGVLLAVMYYASLPRASGIGDVYRLYAGAGALLCLAPLGLAIGIFAALSHIRSQRKRDD